MTRSVHVLSSLVLAIALLQSHAASAQAEITGTVVSIADGDTLTLLSGRVQQRIRLHGIDAPEQTQAFGTRARQYLGLLAFGKAVVVRVKDKDRYGRLVGDVILPDGTIANHEMVRAGLAWWLRKFAPEPTILHDLEKNARARRIGLWSDRSPIPPWEYRNRP